MSYLDSPRLHFSGWFQADVSTINNRVEPFQNDSFVPQYQELNQNGSWNPEGTGIFRLMDCAVTGAFIDGKLLTTPADDPVIGLSLQNADRRAPGKLVDLDPQQQMVSEIWGMQVRVVNGAAQPLLQGEYKPAAFINLWQRQQKAMPRDQTLAAYYQSVLEGVSWPDATGSPLLDALKAATQEDMLSIQFNVYGYGRDSKIPRYTLGHIAGTIGPYRRGEPRHFVMGRQMIAYAPSSFVQPSQGVGSLQAKVSADGMWLTADFGNSFPIEEANSGLMDIGAVSIGVLNTSPATLQTTVDASQVTVIARVPYLEPQWYTQTAGVQSFDLSANAAARQLLPTCPLVLLKPVTGTTTYTVLLQESIEGVYVRADQFVFRLEPGETQHVEFYASSFGVPLPAAAVAISATEGMMGGSGGNGPMHPLPDPPAPIPDIGTPTSAVTYAGSVTTDPAGRARLPVTASSDGPGMPRGYIAGQLYGLGYQLAAQPAGYVGNPLNYVSVLAYSAGTGTQSPTWYQNIQPLFTQYAHLYPIMSRHVVDLSDYASVCSRLAILKLAFALPPRDPNHMPVTRDLSAGDRATILKWLDMKGADGLPPLGTKPPAPPPPAVSKVAATAAAPAATPMPAPGEAGGKTAVIQGYEQRRARAAANSGGNQP
ncbi:hypothetical protein [Ramlibacter sp. WS9]|uniref:hypothetical protein n=1 Tax=Ramlibacter sp. WS9 TaxID=1882741 RepID=UPI00114342A8|nr:hypothetical protein [Ramlibacter sp. WS9]ROZ76208.1 hypothetical protein EEB15_13730 [Ramlibacter sp. WS9]